MQSIATYTTSTRLPAQRRAAQATLATSGCIATRSVPTLQRTVVTRNSLLHHLHRGGDDWLVSGHGDAFADRRHRSGGSRAHRIDKEPPISRPTCRRRLMLLHTCGHKGMCRRLCTASPAAWWVCVGMCACHVFPGMQQPRVPRRATSHRTISNGVCYLRELAAEGWPRCRHRRSCPCLVGKTMRPLHARATRSSGSAVEYSHGVSLE